MPRFWNGLAALPPRGFTCGHCGMLISSDRGYAAEQSKGPAGFIYICPHCSEPTMFVPHQVPGARVGAEVLHLPPDVQALYNEARGSIAAGAHTASVLSARKLLMHLAVEQGAKPGEPFAAYVQFLADAGYVPPNGKHWVDHIRKKGNEANHEIALMTDGDAGELIKFLEMLMKFMYEFPQSVPLPANPS